MKKLTLLLTLILAVSTPAFAGKGKAGKGAAKGEHPGKVLRELDKNGNHQIDGDEVAALKVEFGKAATDSMLKKLDKNSNGVLDDNEITALNARMGKQAGKKGGKKKNK
jgi:hypothetical protein